MSIYNCFPYHEYVLSIDLLTHIVLPFFLTGVHNYAVQTRKVAVSRVPFLLWTIIKRWYPQSFEMKVSIGFHGDASCESDGTCKVCSGTGVQQRELDCQAEPGTNTCRRSPRLKHASEKAEQPSP